MIVGRVVGGNFSFSQSVCMSVDSAGISRVLIKYSGKYVKIYFNMKITFLITHSKTSMLPSRLLWMYLFRHMSFIHKSYHGIFLNLVETNWYK